MKVNPERLSDVTIFGFDSAWSINNKGAICALRFINSTNYEFIEPIQVNFDSAIDFIKLQIDHCSCNIIAIDQPIIVLNERGSRKVDKIAASLISYIGGGVQPANTSRIGLLDQAAPIWHFIRLLDLLIDPHACKTSNSGRFILEVFPALALPNLNSLFSRRLTAPKYNPKNKKKFNIADWQNVCSTIKEISFQLQLNDIIPILENMHDIPNPVKGDQDKLDAIICLIVAFIWRACDDQHSILLGDVCEGFIISPISGDTEERLLKAQSLNYPKNQT